MYKVILLKNNYSKMLGKSKTKKRKRVHGFLRRSLSAVGRRVLKRRRQKGRHKLTV